MMKLDTQEEVDKLCKNVKEATERLGINMKTDLFEILQPYKNGQSIMFKVDEDDEGERVLKVNFFDNTHILPEIDGELDIFK